MTGLKSIRATGLCVVLSVLATLAFAGAAQAHIGVPRATTGGVTNVHGGTGQLEGIVNPEGTESSYYFEYGLTTAYGGKTTQVAVGHGLIPVRVGQSVADLVAGEHYRIVVVYVGGTKPVLGADRTYKSKSDRPKIVVPTGKENEVTVHYGEAAYLTGTLQGLNDAGQPVSFQSTPFPFTSPFLTIPGSAVTSRTGSFVFKVQRLLSSTEFRAETNGPRPLFGPTMVVRVSPLITLHLRKAKGSGSYRLYGSVAPYVKGAVVVIQQLLPQKSGSKREGPATSSAGSTSLKRSSSTLGHFSVTLIFTGTFHYRAFIRLPKGALVSGHSNDVLIRAPKVDPEKQGKRHKRK